MRKNKITQENVYVLIPGKVAKLADRILADRRDGNMEDAIMQVYQSDMYRHLEDESTKFWWLGINALYEELTQPSTR